MKIVEIKDKLTRKIKNSTFFQDKFGFENNIDITDDKAVLYRKNIVIKNIIFATNIIYTLIFTVISIGDPTNTSNWLLTALLFPVTFLINMLLGKMIKKGPEDNLSQTLAMYIASFYMFLSTILIYIKLKYGETDTVSGNYLSECGYILIYYSLLISSFYQDKKMLKNIFIWVLVIVTILHFVVTYNLVQQAGTDILAFFSSFFSGTEFRDIVIRTILLGLFMLVLYIYVSMTTTIANERKKETERRRNVEEEYVNTVTDIFKITLPKYELSEDEKKETILLSQMAKKLAENLTFESSKVLDIYNYSRLLIDEHVDYDDLKDLTLDERLAKIKERRELSIKIINRIELSRKIESVFRYVYDGGNNDEFIVRERQVLGDLTSQIIFVCYVYINLRSYKYFKKPINHKKTMEMINENYKIYFDSLVYDRFTRFDGEFERLFDED